MRNIYEAISHMEAMKAQAFVSCLLAVLIVCSTQALSPASTSAEPCVPTIVGIDTSKVTASASPDLGKAKGQTFLALDTLIQSITVWRASSQDTSYFGWHLYIIATDSLGRPAPASVILDGPTIFNFFGDGVHHIPMRFEFDPPFALPGPGKYEFAIVGVPCDATFLILYNTTNAYPDGDAWLHGRSSFTGCGPRNFPTRAPESDMIFEIAFCDTSTVPILPETWGKIKATYR